MAVNFLKNMVSKKQSFGVLAVMVKDLEKLLLPRFITEIPLVKNIMRLLLKEKTKKGALLRKLST